MPATLKSRIPAIVAAMPGLSDAAMEAGAEMIADRARVLAPVGTGSDPHPGRLRDSIHVEKLDEGFAVVADAQADPRKSGSQGAFYAVFLEFGAYNGKVHHPFLVPAAEAMREVIVGLEVAVLRSL